MLQWIRSLTFIVLATVYMPLLGLLYAPWATFSRRGAYAACKAYAAGTMWMAKVIVGLRCAQFLTFGLGASGYACALAAASGLAAPSGGAPTPLPLRASLPVAIR